MHTRPSTAHLLHPVQYLLLAVLAVSTGGAGAEAPNRDEVIRLSQEAIGGQLGHYELRDSQGRQVDLNRYRGAPLVISPIYTGCAHVCPATTRNLALAIRKARAALGEQSFNVVTIGFDPPRDNPETMSDHARQQGVSDPDWKFLSGSKETIQALMADIGFSYWRSPKGYDHLTQTTIIDSDGVIYAHIYGELVHLPQLVEPLKRLVFGVDSEQDSMMDTIIKRVSYFCTDYDPVTGAYKFDYSLFLGMMIGAVIILSVITFLVVNLKARHKPQNEGGWSV